jgi:CelD/BcsL family acetyltransferase involved in cellulose biosynthesis
VSEWDELVAGDDGALPFHLPAWSQLLAECYGLRPLVVLAGGGGLPLLQVGRRRWSALPFTDVCPPLGDAGAVTRELDRMRGGARVEVRAPLPGAASAAVARRHVLALAPDLESRFHPSQVARNIRRAEREGVTVRTAACEADVTRVYYDLHVRTRRRLGAPVQRRRFFSLLWRHLLAPGHGYALIAEHEGRAAAAAIFLTAGRTTVYKYGASDERLWSVRPNHVLFRDAIRRACADGHTAFDFGRTDFEDEGLRQFKLGWGAAEEQLVHSCLGRAPAPARGSRAAHLARRTLQVAPPWVSRAAGLLYGHAA